MAAKLPKIIFVSARVDKDNDPPYLLAERHANQAIEDDGPTAVGIYRLLETRILTKVVMTGPAKRARRKK
jgi:hypothetical protein